jgi:hypothetical protein
VDLRGFPFASFTSRSNFSYFCLAPGARHPAQVTQNRSPLNSFGTGRRARLHRSQLTSLRAEHPVPARSLLDFSFSLGFLHSRAKGMPWCLFFPLRSCCRESGHPARGPCAGAPRACARSRPVFFPAHDYPVRFSFSRSRFCAPEHASCLIREGFAMRPSPPKIFLDFVVPELVKILAVFLGSHH